MHCVFLRSASRKMFSVVLPIVAKLPMRHPAFQLHFIKRKFRINFIQNFNEMHQKNKVKRIKNIK